MRLITREELRDRLIMGDQRATARGREAGC